METNPLDLFDTKKYVKIGAPMVRYSKLQFRQLLRLYDCDLAFSPMILADSFTLSEKARANEFTTSLSMNSCIYVKPDKQILLLIVDDSPLIVQFAANNVTDFVAASLLVSPFCNGVDLNCGCPQRWAKKLGLGCALIDKPELICSMVKECRSMVKKQHFTVSVKTRILRDMKKCIDLCRMLDKAGVSFISIHGRTPDQPSGQIHSESIRLVQENVSCPVVANGAVETLQDCENLHEATKCQGVMVANGLLTNPMLFSGQKPDWQTVKELLHNWIVLCYHKELRPLKQAQLINILDVNIPSNVSFQCFHHHLVFMLSKVLTRHQKQKFNNLRTFAHVLQFLSDHKLLDSPCIDLNHSALTSNQYEQLSLIYNHSDNDYIYNTRRDYHRIKQSALQGSDSLSNGKFFAEFTLDDLFAD